ncbi:hypothetical protein GIB67_021856 [Kingdonia uniflora]|uniref:Uncharacterized protein n=1 Tax=Kingdonia uniflora TaxID=39325 RepID=A0A7J7NUY3_9MAGN|nr:hypothetical protein GIB67_021856 [Kingdonia uniflora]
MWGLPLAIVTLARALRKEDKGVWTDVIRLLKTSTYEGLDPVKTSISELRLLEIKQNQTMFLACALFPEDHKVTMDALVGDDEGYVMMHDIVHATAISIAGENRNESIMRAGSGLQKWPKLKEPGSVCDCR